jgi:hypothetical protein
LKENFHALKETAVVSCLARTQTHTQTQTDTTQAPGMGNTSTRVGEVGREEKRADSHLAEDRATPAEQLVQATFAGGCFWWAIMRLRARFLACSPLYRVEVRIDKRKPYQHTVYGGT